MIRLLEYEEAWREQKDLDAVTRPMRAPGLERYWPNENYGFSSILKVFSGYPIRKPICAVIPHGVYLGGGDKAPPAELNAPYRTVLTYPDYLDIVWKRAGRAVIPMASPFLYAREYMRKQGVLREDIERHGTLFFPAHSTAACSVKTSAESTIRQLRDLPDEMKPVTICMHWYDHSQGLHKPYRKAGFPLVAAGSLHDPAFLVRLIHLMSAFSYAGSNSVGSSTFYALEVGLDSFTLDVEYSVQVTGGFPRAELSEERRLAHARLKELFLLENGSPLEAKRETAKYHLRTDQLKDSDGLLVDLLYAEKLARGPAR